jgi:putative ABC transport system ATP-binding protein
VDKTYRMGEIDVPVLHDVNLDVRQGEFLVVLGPSGSGKSTLLNLIGGLDRPTRGEVWYRDRNLAELSDRELTLYRRREVGFIFQFYNLVPTLTALENVAVSTEIGPEPLRPDEVIEMVGLAGRKDHFPSQMSGGEQQRVAIARAVAKNPRLLLCDEPTGSLDLATGREVLALLSRLNRAAPPMGKTVILITHNAAIGAMADRVIRIGSGRIQEEVVHESPISAREVVW